MIMITKILTILLPMAVFVVSIWMMTIPSLHAFGVVGLWLIVAMCIFGVFLAIWRGVKLYENRNTPQAPISSGQLWTLTILVFATLVSAVLHLLSEGLTLSTTIHFLVVVYGVYWLWSHRKQTILEH